MKMHNVSTEGASPGGRRLSRSFHSCLRGADHDDLESGRFPITGLNVNERKRRSEVTTARNTT